MMQTVANPNNLLHKKHQHHMSHVIYIYIYVYIRQPDSSFNLFKVSMPAVIARGLPLSVPAWYMGPAGATISMMSLRPP